MNHITLYTKKLELKFDNKGVSILNLEDIASEILKDYIILDPNPVVSVHENFQYITFKVSKKKEEKSLGFSFGKKE